MITKDNIKKVFGFNLKKLRNINKLTQEQLAEKIGLDYKTVSFIETGRTFVSSEVIAKLANYFNVEPEYFFKNHTYNQTDAHINLKSEINRLLADCDEKLLQTVFNIICVLKK